MHLFNIGLKRAARMIYSLLLATLQIFASDVLYSLMGNYFPSVISSSLSYHVTTIPFSFFFLSVCLLTHTQPHSMPLSAGRRMIRGFNGDIL